MNSQLKERENDFNSACSQFEYFREVLKEAKGRALDETTEKLLNAKEELIKAKRKLDVELSIYKF
ncbi:hypothetical protein AVI51_15110 [Piscirickettsia salmonis]|uniref:Uncharacterized protein n=1 Tax=Piscirickettsia salmonis TaxID=1238 RepID=A0A9Q5VCZ7_PISSA|nr:hypothetical protein [Piscirickettsia salmonis]ALA24360.1 helicase domain protein [Piscirickettsia salmonis]APS44732.1 hypothetical protein AVI48_10395 [Piscirickettsia salmonis]APS48092.1 hypothetical protein AVI49_11000 [Piscirickettsia salmonis]APS52048.1 hypothetical protein AVI50_15265 [Piscirickettsia salmonis]APS55266.1 hypothetical protein AVI51_15110 [Piscirickettsia salmonis]